MAPLLSRGGRLAARCVAQRPCAIVDPGISEATLLPQMIRDALIERAITHETKRCELEHGEVVAMLPELLDHVRAGQWAYTALGGTIQSGSLPGEVIGDGFVTTCCIG